MSACISASPERIWKITRSRCSREQDSSCEQSRSNAWKEKEREKEREWSMEVTTERLHAVDGKTEMLALASLTRWLVGKIST
jgi:hypothetical protein